MFKAFNVAGSALLLAGCAATQPSSIIPQKLNPSAGEAMTMIVPAKGVQIYTCGKNPAGAWAWTFKGPEAELFDTSQKTIGKHYGGPTWEGTDGGKVVGAAKANVPAPTGNDIPWLWLEIKSSEGSGQFTQAKAIQRILTLNPWATLFTAYRSVIYEGTLPDWVSLGQVLVGSLVFLALTTLLFKRLDPAFAKVL